jgi:seryl-tRNA synthetase
MPLSSVGLDAALATAEQLKRELRYLEEEEKRVKRELEEVTIKKQNIMNQLKKFNDDEYEKNMLHLVYEQRHHKNG